MTTINKKNRGFTLVELLIVISIIGILAVVAIPSLFKHINKSKYAKDLLHINAIEKAELMYFTENGEHTFNEEDAKDAIPSKKSNTLSRGSILEKSLLSLKNDYIDGEIKYSMDNGLLNLSIAKDLYWTVKDDGVTWYISHDKYNDNDDDNDNNISPDEYDSEEYSPDKVYQYGDIVHSADGIIYMAADNFSNIKPPAYIDRDTPAWMAIGRTDGEYLEYRYDTLYRIGTIVKHKGKLYAFTPNDNTEHLSANRYPQPGSESSTNDTDKNWTEVGSDYVKPPKAIEFKDKEVLDYDDARPNNKFVKGEYYSYRGTLYQCLNPRLAESNPPGTASSSSVWKAVPNFEDNSLNQTFYKHDTVYQKGNVVWYKGNYYKCLRQNVCGTRPNYKSNSIDWKLMNTN